MKMLRKCISTLLTICLMLSLLPVHVLAETTPSLGEEIQVQQYSVSVDETLGEKPLYEGYAMQQFYGNSESFLSNVGGAMLTGDEALLYNGLKSALQDIAAGRRESAIISVGEELEYDGEIYAVDAEALFSSPDLTNQMLDRLIDALLTDMPYHLYWYDKVSGVGVTTFTSDRLVQVIFYFTVAENYRGADEYTANTALTGAATRAAANAEAIVDKYADCTDYEKLAGYRDEIQSLVTYDYDAAEGGYFTTNIDPWQLISVFDGDPTTNVVCEGYSKAFMYLCDISAFSDLTACQTVTGEMNGGAHMWNIVELFGRHYLVDVTNYDDGMYSDLFMGGATGSVTGGYTVAGLLFTYDTDMLNLWGTQEGSLLELEETAFDPALDWNTVGVGKCGDNVSWKLARSGELTISGTGAMYDFGNTGVPWDPYCEEITSVTVAEGITYIGDFAFQYCSNAAWISVPSTVTAIGRRAFAYCSSMTSLTLPKGLTSISNGLFYNCSGLSEMTIPQGVTTIDNEAFIGCSGLTSMTIPGKVTSIGDSAFMHCTSLKKIEIPVSVKSVGMNAFYKCLNLTDVYYAGTESQWNQITVGENNAELLFANIHYGTSILLDAPVITNAFSQTGGLLVSWDGMRDVEKYRLYVKTSNGWTKVGDTTETSFLYTGAKNGQTYTFTLRGLSADGKAFVTEYNTAGWTYTYQPTPEITWFESTASGIKITWGAINGVEKYRVFAKTSKGWTKLADTTGTTFTWTGAKLDATYTFTVRGLNAAGTAFTTPYYTNGYKHSYVAAPVITGFESAPIGVTINWDPLERAAGYRVFVKTSKGWSKIGETGGISFTWTEAVPGKTYTFTIRALDGYTNTYPHCYISAYNTAGWKYKYAPVPEVTKLESTTDGIKLTWDAISGAGKYRVFAKTSKGWTKLGDTTGNSFVWTGAKAGLTYTFTVRAMNAEATAFVTAYNTTGWKHKYYPAPKVTKLESTASGVKLTWGAINGAGKYRVFVMNANGGWTKVGDTTGTTFTWTGAKTEQSYTFTVRAMNADATAYVSAYSTVGWDHTYYPAPAVTKLESTTGGVKLTWGKINGAGKYRVFVKTSSGWTKVGDTTATSFTWTGAKAGTSYTFTVRAMNAGATAYVSTFNASGWKHTYYPTPAVTKLENTSGGIKLTWGAINGVGKYRVYVKTSSGWTKVGDTTATTFTWTGAKAGQTYTFTVRAMNAGATAFVSAYNATGWSIKCQ